MFAGHQGYDISFAVTEDHDVLSWGAKGTGATGHRLGTGTYDEDEDAYLEPKPVRDLIGEEVFQVALHAHLSDGTKVPRSYRCCPEVLASVVEPCELSA